MPTEGTPKASPSPVWPGSRLGCLGAGLRFSTVRTTALTALVTLAVFLAAMAGSFHFMSLHSAAVSEVTERTHPLRDAAQEMEINVGEFATSVDRYLHNPSPAHRLKAEEDVREFLRALDRFRSLASDAEQVAAAERAEASFASLARTGRMLVTLQDQEDVLRSSVHATADAVASHLDRLERMLLADSASADDAGSRPGTGHSMVHVLRRLVNEATLELVRRDGHTTADDGGPVPWGEAGLEALQAASADLGDRAPDLRDTASLWQAYAGRLEELLTVRARIDREFDLFEGDRQALDDLLDEQVQVLAGQAAASAERRANESRRAVVLVTIGGLIIVFVVTIGAWWLSAETVRRKLSRIETIMLAIAAEENPAALSMPAAPEDKNRLPDEFETIASLLCRLGERVLKQRRLLQEQNQSLEATVREQTLALATAVEQLKGELVQRDAIERELEGERNAARAANQAKSVFLANMSHELRTPLNAIIGFAELLQLQLAEARTSGRQGEYAQLIGEAGRHLLGLIEDVLDAARLEVGRLSISPTDVAVADLIAECTRICQGRAAESHVGLTASCRPPDLVIFSDPIRLRQILINLIVNAVKFSPTGGTVDVGGHLEDDRVVLTVTDQGVGMSDEEIVRALQPFAQLHEGLSRKWEGLGLGLTIANGLCAALDGRLEIRSRKGAGTAVRVVLPRVWEVRPPTDNGAGVLPPAITPSGGGTGWAIATV